MTRAGFVGVWRSTVDCESSPSFVRQELGDLDDLEVARIVALGATEGEICEAAAWLYADTDALRDLPGPSTAKVQQILGIARPAADDEDETSDPTSALTSARPPCRGGLQRAR